jgi:hypothetical protein
LAEKTRSAGIANSLTGGTLCTNDDSMEPHEIESNREYSKIYLQQFVDNLNAENFIDSVEEIINTLDEQLTNELNNFYEFQRNNPEGYSVDTDYLEDKLRALTEMNIVYSYKEFEINLKRLIKMTYKVDTKELFKWESIKAFLKTKNINITTLKGYNEVDQLRQVNNSIKHSSSIDDKIKGIKEFKGREHVNYSNLYKFHKRVKKQPYIFLQSLSDSIYDNLYVFDENRLEKIAELYAERMDKDTAVKFIEYLKTKY